MKTIDRRFVMRMLEKDKGKPAKQIEEDAANWNPDEWPAGTDELENRLAAGQGYAKTTLDYFHGRRPSNITREDVEEIFRRNSGRTLFMLTDAEIEGHRKRIHLIFDVYEEVD